MNLIGEAQPQTFGTPTVLRAGCYQHHLLLRSDLFECRRVQDVLLAHLHEKRCRELDRSAILVSVQEVVVNAIKHGNRFDPSKRVILEFGFAPDGFHGRVEDEGPGLDLSALEPPNVSGEEPRGRGRGIWLVRQLMTWVRLEPPGRTVALFKSLTTT